MASQRNHRFHLPMECGDGRGGGQRTEHEIPSPAAARRSAFAAAKIVPVQASALALGDGMPIMAALRAIQVLRESSIDTEKEMR